MKRLFLFVLALALIASIAPRLASAGQHPFSLEQTESLLPAYVQDAFFRALENPPVTASFLRYFHADELVHEWISKSPLRVPLATNKPASALLNGWSIYVEFRQEGIIFGAENVNFYVEQSLMTDQLSCEESLDQTEFCQAIRNAMRFTPQAVFYDNVVTALKGAKTKLSTSIQPPGPKQTPRRPKH